MRTTALPSVLEVVSRNWGARAAECAVFEQATEYTPSPSATRWPDNDFNDYPALCESSAAEGKPLGPAAHGNTKLHPGAYGAKWDYLAIKGVVEKLLATAGVTGIPCAATRRAPPIIPAAPPICTWAKPSWPPWARCTWRCAPITA